MAVRYFVQREEFMKRFAFIAVFMSLSLFFAACSEDSTTNPSVVAAPTFSPPGGSYASTQQVAISCATDGATITYTTDGGTPTSSSTEYTGPVAVSTTSTLKAKAFKSGWTSSPVASASYTITPLSTLVLVEGGTFNNGVSDVTVSSFYIDKYEITQASFELVMGYDPASGYGDGDDYPVYNVTWRMAIEYCNKRSVLEGITPCYSYAGYGTDPDDWPVSVVHTDFSCNWSANGYRLPTEMEWMFAARGGNATHGYVYSGSNNIDEVAWYHDNAYAVGTSHPDYGPHVVGTKAPNELGLYDMTGNMTECVWDIYGDYPAGPQTDPTGPTSGTYRARRGGSWSSVAYGCTIEYRFGASISETFASWGFRVCRKTL